MNNRKALANSFYALIASLSLMAGMTMLSVTGPGNQADVQTPGELNSSPDIPGNLSSGNTSIDSGDMPQNVSAPDIQEDGLIAKTARSLYKMISGSEVEPPERPPEGNMSDLNGSTGNITGNQTFNNSQGGLNDTPEFNGSIPNTTKPNETSSPETGDNNSSGFFTDIMKQLAGMIDLSGNRTQQEPGNRTPPDLNQTPPQNDTTENMSSSEPEPEENQSSPAQNETGTSMPSAPPNILPAILLLVAGAAVFLAYRSDIRFIPLLKRFANRIRRFLVSIPDLFRRAVVRSVVFISSRIRKILSLMIALAKAPVETLENLVDNTKKRIEGIVTSLKMIREIGLSGALKRMVPGEKKPEGGLELVWYLLKDKAGVHENTLTPKEIGDRAREQGVDPATVDDVVKAYRWENYSEEGYPNEFKIDDWREELGDDDR